MKYEYFSPAFDDYLAMVLGCTFCQKNKKKKKKREKGKKRLMSAGMMAHHFPHPVTRSPIQVLGSLLLDIHDQKEKTSGAYPQHHLKWKGLTKATREVNSS